MNECIMCLQDVGWDGLICDECIELLDDADMLDAQIAKEA